MVTYDKLVISGGGLKGIMALGIISSYLDSLNVKTYAGTSVGSLICVLLSIGYSPLNIITRLIKIKPINQITIQQILSFTKKYGFLDTDIMFTPIMEMIQEKIGILPSFRELFDITGKHVIICAANINTLESRYFDYIRTPAVSVYDAMKASCALPGFFQPVIINNEFYSDGGLTDPFPLPEVNIKEGRTLGIILKGLVCASNEKLNIINFYSRCISIPLYEIIRLKLKDCDLSNVEIIEAVCTDVCAFALYPDTGKMLDLYIAGEKLGALRQKP